MFWDINLYFVVFPQRVRARAGRRQRTWTSARHRARRAAHTSACTTTERTERATCRPKHTCITNVTKLTLFNQPLWGCPHKYTYLFLRCSYRYFDLSNHIYITHINMIRTIEVLLAKIWLNCIDEVPQLPNFLHICVPFKHCEGRCCVQVVF